jgi:hypothetical protein
MSFGIGGIENHFFAFGPSDTYVACLPGFKKWSPNLPERMASVLTGSKFVYFVVFPPSTSTDSSGNAITTATPALDAYIKYANGLFGLLKLHFPTSLVCPGLKELCRSPWGPSMAVGNGRGGWWARSMSGKSKCSGLSGEVLQCLKPKTSHGIIINLALGVNNSYVVIFSTGRTEWDLKESYDVLDEMLATKHNREVIYVSLNPYCPGQFFVVFSDKTAYYSFPETETYKKLEEEMLSIEKLRFISKSRTAKTTKGRTETDVSANDGMTRICYNSLNFRLCL